MEYIIDKKNRRIVFKTTTLNLEGEAVVINEFDKLEKTFLKNTSDTYACELILLDVEIENENTQQKEVETKAFARRIGFESWLMEFDPTQYKKIEG